MDLGWSEFTRGAVAEFEVPGTQRDARETMQEPHVGYLADRLTEADLRIGSVAGTGAHQHVRKAAWTSE